MKFFDGEETVLWVLPMGRRLYCGFSPWGGDYIVGSSHEETGALMEKSMCFGGFTTDKEFKYFTLKHHKQVDFVITHLLCLYKCACHSFICELVLHRR